MFFLPIWIIALVYILADLRKKKKLTVKKGIILSIIFLCFLPWFWYWYKDGGSQEVWSPTYQVIKWHTIDRGPDLPGHEGWEIHICPANFHSISYWKQKHGY